MSSIQKIVITPEGEVITLRQKSKKGLDLRDLGKVSVKRQSDILFNEDNQSWYVLILSTGDTLKSTDGIVKYFLDREDAEEAEIEYLNNVLDSIA